MKTSEKSVKRFDRFLDFLAVISSVLILFMVVSVCFEVVSRYFFNAPTIWVVEVCSIILLFVPFFIGAWVLRRDGHVKMDLVLDQFSFRNQAIIKIVTSAIAALSCLILVLFGIKLTWHFYETSYYTNTILRLPKSPLTAVIPFGFLLIFIQCVRNFLSNIGDARKLQEKS